MFIFISFGSKENYVLLNFSEGIHNILNELRSFELN